MIRRPNDRCSVPLDAPAQVEFHCPRSCVVGPYDPVQRVEHLPERPGLGQRPHAPQPRSEPSGERSVFDDVTKHLVARQRRRRALGQWLSPLAQINRVHVRRRPQPRSNVPQTPSRARAQCRGGKTVNTFMSCSFLFFLEYWNVSAFLRLRIVRWAEDVTLIDVRKIPPPKWHCREELRHHGYTNAN